MKKKYSWFKKSLVFFAFMAMAIQISAQHSVARQWNEALLNGIRNDFARPTVHARNLWHTSIAMYDAWAIYTNSAETYFVGDTVGDFYCPFTPVAYPANVKAAQEEAMSYAMYRIMYQRFIFSPGSQVTLGYVDSLFLHLGYDPTITSTNYSAGGPAELGNYIAQELIAFGLQDSSNEQIDYINTFYQAFNPPLDPTLPGNDSIIDPNKWQPLTLGTFIDQSGNLIPIKTPEFLGPEWGEVTAFALDTLDKVTHIRDGNPYNIFHNPPTPPHIDTVSGSGRSQEYMWNFKLVSKWSSHLDTADGVMWDVSPNSIGNVQNYPTSMDSLYTFYNEQDGGDYGIGYTVNPSTGLPYPTQMVPRADYARVLAEFWADGPDSETPPGHWFTLLNNVTDHALFTRKWKGAGPVLDDLEWDVKSYFTLSGAMHDAAVTSWGIKGYYDYIRPISALRYMAAQGQSSDSTLPSYSVTGIPLDSGYVELIDSTDALAGVNYTNVGKIKIYAWQGPDSIPDPAIDMAGVSWILADHWWPYQRPSFVTPPFAGFVSGHSTFSRAAAEVMTFITGDEYFPGGMAEYVAKKNDFLVFEEGPSMDVHLQWATYRDASDQCSLSRIWGGIHPPADDIPGRLIGIEIGTDAFDLAKTYWENGVPDVTRIVASTQLITDVDTGVGTFTIQIHYDSEMDTNVTPTVLFPVENPMAKTLNHNSALSGWTSNFVYTTVYDVADSAEVLKDINVAVTGAKDVQGNSQPVFAAADNFSIEMENPQVIALVATPNIFSELHVGNNNATITATFSEIMDTSSAPVVSFPVENPTLSLSSTAANGVWLNNLNYQFTFDLIDIDETIDSIDVRVVAAKDAVGNLNEVGDFADLFKLDTEKPKVILVETSHDSIMFSEVGIATFQITLTYNELMDLSKAPDISFPVEDPLALSLTYNPDSSYWISPTQFVVAYDVSSTPDQVLDVDIMMELGNDPGGNQQIVHSYMNVFSVFKQVGFGLNDYFSADGLRTYPNPLHNGENIYISFKETSVNGIVELKDLQGRLVYKREFSTDNGNVISVSTEGLHSGTYLLSIQSGKTQHHTKVLILN